MGIGVRIFYKAPIIATIILYFLTFFKGVFEKSFNFFKNFSKKSQIACFVEKISLDNLEEKIYNSGTIYNMEVKHGKTVFRSCGDNAAR